MEKTKRSGGRMNWTENPCAKKENVMRRSMTQGLPSASRRVFGGHASTSPQFSRKNPKKNRRQGMRRSISEGMKSLQQMQQSRDNIADAEMKNLEFKMVSKRKITISRRTSTNISGRRLGKALYLFELHHPVRELMCRIEDNPAFNLVILLLILANCVFLALDDGSTVSNETVLITEWIFTSLFTAEAVVRIISRGFYWCGEVSYLRDVFNKLDFFVLIMSYISLIFGLNNLSAIRGFRVLKPLRAIKSIHGLRVLVTALLASMPGLLDVLTVFSFFLFFFGILGLQLFSGKFRQRCVNSSTNEVSTTGASRLCSITSSLDGHLCGINEYCQVTGQNPRYGAISFDNIGISLVTILTASTLEGWSETMSYASDSYSITIARFFFIFLVIIVGLFIFKLVLAVVFIKFDRIKSEVFEIDTFMSRARNQQQTSKVDLLESKKFEKRKVRRIRTYIPPPQNRHLRSVYWFVQSDGFQGWIIIAILLNLIVLCLEHEGQTSLMTSILFLFNVVLTCVFGLELILKLIGLGFRGYIADGMNVFDAFVVAFSVLEIILTDGAGSFSVLRSFRVVRIFKLLRTWVGLQNIVKALSNSISEIGYFLLILGLFMFVYVILGLQLFRGKFSFDDVEDSRPNFDNIGLGLLTVFQIVTGENWNEVMYKGIRALGWAAVVYFVSLYAMGLVLMSLFLAIILANFNIVDEKVDQVSNVSALKTMVISALCCNFRENRSLVDNNLTEKITTRDEEEDYIIDLKDSKHVWGDDSKVDRNMSLGSKAVFPGLDSHQSPMSANSTQRFEIKRIPTFTTVPLIPLSPFLRTSSNRPADFKTPQSNQPALSRTKSVPMSSNGNNKSVIPLFLHKPSTSYSSTQSDQHMVPKPSPGQRCGNRVMPDVCDANAGKRPSPNKMFLGNIHRSGASERLSVPIPPILAREEGAKEMMGKSKLFGGARVLRRGPSFLRSEIFDHPEDLKPQAKLKRRKKMRDLSLLLLTPASDGPLDSAPEEAPPAERKRSRKPSRRLHITSRTVRDQTEADVEAQTSFQSVRAPSASARQRTLHLSSQRTMRFKSEIMLEIEGYSFGMFSPFNPFRIMCVYIVEHPVFNRLVYFVIIFSCICLSLDGPHVTEGSDLHNFLYVSDVTVTSIFTSEMFLHMVAYCVYDARNAYLRDIWNQMDCSVVLISIMNIFFQRFRWFKVLRSFRAFRAWRTITHSQNMRIVVKSILSTLHMFGNIAMVMLVIFLIFGVIGVQLFKGRLRLCIQNDGTQLPQFNEDECLSLGHRWENPNIANFDNIGSALILLVEVASVEMWPDRMYTVMDATPSGERPRRNGNAVPAALFFVSFFIIGSFLVISLVISVVVDGYYLHYAHETGGGLNKSQMLWMKVYREISFRPPIRMVFPPAKPECLAWARKVVFDVVQSTSFEIAITVLILINVLIMMMNYYGEPQQYSMALSICNDILALVFLLEMLFKWFGLGIPEYFRSHYNKFDCFIVVVSVVVFVFRMVALVSTQIDPVIFRVFRVLRIFRLMVKSKGLQRMMNTLWWSFSALSNILLILLLVTFIFAVAGVSLFGEVRYGTFLNERSNFENFGNSFTTLITLATGEHWNGIMHDATIQPPECEQGKDCGTYVAIPFFLLYVLISQWFMINILVAVIVKNYEEEDNNDRQWAVSPIKPQDIDKFQEEWKTNFGEDRFVSIYKCLAFIAALKCGLKLPLRMKPYMLSIPQTVGRKVHYLDVLHALCEEKFRIFFPSGIYQDIPPKNPLLRLVRIQVFRNYPELRTMQLARFCLDHYFAAIKLQRWFRRRKRRKKMRRSASDDSTYWRPSSQIVFIGQDEKKIFSRKVSTVQEIPGIQTLSFDPDEVKEKKNSFQASYDRTVSKKFDLPPDILGANNAEAVEKAGIVYDRTVSMKFKIPLPGQPIAPQRNDDIADITHLDRNMSLDQKQFDRNLSMGNSEGKPMEHKTQELDRDQSLGSDNNPVSSLLVQTSSVNRTLSNTNLCSENLHPKEALQPSIPSQNAEGDPPDPPVTGLEEHDEIKTPHRERCSPRDSCPKSVCPHYSSVDISDSKREAQPKFKDQLPSSNLAVIPSEQAPKPSWEQKAMQRIETPSGIPTPRVVSVVKSRAKKRENRLAKGIGVRPNSAAQTEKNRKLTSRKSGSDSNGISPVNAGPS